MEITILDAKINGCSCEHWTCYLVTNGAKFGIVEAYADTEIDHDDIEWFSSEKEAEETFSKIEDDIW